MLETVAGVLLLAAVLVVAAAAVYAGVYTVLMHRHGIEADAMARRCAAQAARFLVALNVVLSIAGACFFGLRH